ncbi:MAG: MFS transporter [Bacteroidales bacterium]|nr:MFS transporter [Bacteroidales bacterium]MDD4030364.1 MFS transporter [Bacteroidales bacterium]MDD4435037.1 MFS transporter [Bacteroidales bacterium]
MNKVIKLLRDSKWARWAVLLCLSLVMYASYFFDDQFTTISHIFKNPAILDLAWTSGDYGMYGGAYSLLCVWGGLIICGMLLDKWGVRVTGTLFVLLMVGGAAVVMYGISSSFNDSGLYRLMARAFAKPSLTMAYAGCAVFGLGSEIAGVAVTRSIAKWFRGKEMALAMGLQLALARLGTATALIVVPRIVTLNDTHIPFSETSKPALVGFILLLCGMIVWGIFLAFDKKLDTQTAEEALRNAQPVAKEDKFKFSDIFKILGNKHYILISLLCVFFYACIISFRRFATSIIIPRFEIEGDVASLMVALIPFTTMVFTPIFGSLVDIRGKATRWMILGSFLVLVSHLIIAFAPGIPVFGYIGIAILGVGYSLVPAAMWPSVPKIIPEKNLGTAYSLIYWIQNMGMLLVPIFVGQIIEKNIDNQIRAAVHAEYLFIGLALAAIVVSLILSRSSDANPHLQLDVPNKARKTK